MPPRSFITESGFTLVEALVAASLVAVSMAALAHLAAVGLRQSVVTAHALTALVSAQSKLEQLTANALVIGGGDEIADLVLRWTIEPIEPADPTILRIAVCAYGWRERDSRPEACVATIRTTTP
jgi:hypothetical protein